MFIGGDYEGHPSHIGRKMCLLAFVPHFTDTQSLTRDTPYCARSTLDIVLQAR